MLQAACADAVGPLLVTTAPTAPAATRPTPSVVLSIVAVDAAAVREVHNLLLHNWLGLFGELRSFGRPGGWYGRCLSRQRIGLDLRFWNFSGSQRSGHLRRRC